MFDPWVGKIPCKRAWQPTPVFLPGESHGQRSLVGYSPWSHNELDVTEVTEHVNHATLAQNMLDMVILLQWKVNENFLLDSISLLLPWAGYSVTHSLFLPLSKWGCFLRILLTYYICLISLFGGVHERARTYDEPRPSISFIDFLGDYF